MYLAPGLEMPLLLSDLFIVSQGFPREHIENCVSCSQKDIKWGLVSSAKKLLGMKIDTHTHARTHNVSWGIFLCPIKQACPLTSSLSVLAR